MRFNKILVYGCVISVAVFAATASAGVTSSSKPPIVLGMAFAYSGPFVGGEAPLVNGVKMAVADVNAQGGINGRRLKMVSEDTGSQQTGAVNAYNLVLSQNPVAVMDTTVSGFVLSQMPTIAKTGIPTFTGAASTLLSRQSQGSENLFRIRTSDARVPRAAALYAINVLHAKKIGILKVNNQYGDGWESAITQVVAAHPQVKVVAVETDSDTDTDVTPQLLSLRNAGADVVISANDPPIQVISMRERQQLGLKYTWITSNAGVLPTTLKLVPNQASEGVYGTVDALPQADKSTKGWAERYQKEFGIPADFSAAEYYDGVIMLSKALRAVGTNRFSLTAYLDKIRAYRGIGNVYAFDGKADGGARVLIVKVHDGTPQIVKQIVG